MMKISVLSTWLTLVLTHVSAQVAPIFPQLYAFGDSLVDNGNLFAAFPGALPFPRASNGALLIEYVAGALGLTVTPSLFLTQTPDLNGNNFAVISAYSIDEDLQEGTPRVLNLPTQVDAFLMFKQMAAPQDALYTMAIGSNDIFAAGNFLEDAYGTFTDDVEPSPSPVVPPKKKITGKKDAGKKSGKKGGKEVTKPVDKPVEVVDFLAPYLALAENRIKEAIDSQIAEVAKLASAGAKKFLIFTVTDMSLEPQNILISEYFIANAKTKKDKILGERMPQINRDLSQLHRDYQAQQVAEVLENQFPDAQFAIYNSESGFSALIDSGTFTYTEQPCLLNYQSPAYTSPAQNPNCVLPGMAGFFFFDEIHPTTAAYMALAPGVVEFIMEQFV